MMEDEQYIGNLKEIDTDIERSQIEYRPKVSYEPDRPFSVTLEQEQHTSDDESILEDDDQSVTNERPAEQFEEFTSISKDLDETIEYVENEISDMEIKLDEDQINKIVSSFPLISNELKDGNSIDFSLYKKTFDDPENPSSVLIQDIVHDYASDVDGNLELEFYEDLREMKSTLEEVYYLFSETILKDLVGQSVPADLETNPSFIETLNEAAKLKQAQFEHLSETYKEKEEQYYDSLRNEYGSPSFFKISEEYLKAKRPYDIAIRENKSTDEMDELIDKMLISYSILSNDTKIGITTGSDIDDEEVMTVLEKQVSTKEQFATLMKLSQLALKLQVNQQIEEKRQYRDILKNINSLSKKRRAHDELLFAFNLRNKMYLNMYDTLQHLESPSKEYGVESFLDQLAGGLELVQSQYDSFVADIYQMYSSEFEVRSEKIEKTLEKENARSGYALVLSQQ